MKDICVVNKFTNYERLSNRTVHIKDLNMTFQVRIEMSDLYTWFRYVKTVHSVEWWTFTQKYREITLLKEHFFC